MDYFQVLNYPKLNSFVRSFVKDIREIAKVDQAITVKALDGLVGGTNIRVYLRGIWVKH